MLARGNVLNMQPDELDDEELLRRIAKADAAAFAALLSRHLPRVKMLGVRMLGDRGRAEDITQDVFLKLWQAPQKWQPGKARFTSWLSRVTSNACIDEIRRRKPVALDEHPEPVNAEPGPLDAALDTERARRVEKALQGLPERQRFAIVLCHYQGHTNKEGADIMDISVEAIESLLARARRALRTGLAGEVKALLNEI